MPAQAIATEKIFKRFKHLREHLQPDEVPLFTMPAIWDGVRAARTATACDVIVTNKRIFGYIYTTFPRERLFLDALPLASIQAITLREKAFEPVFRELLVSSGERKIYIRAPRQKIEDLRAALRQALGRENIETRPAPASGDTEQESSTQSALPIFGTQDMQGTFERSLLSILVLFVGGLLLEILGVVIWFATQSAQTGLPLCGAGLVAVITSILLMRQRR
jgi:hypothetical protein